jgi:hypothetical protein
VCTCVESEHEHEYELESARRRARCCGGLEHERARSGGCTPFSRGGGRRVVGSWDA